MYRLRNYRKIIPFTIASKKIHWDKLKATEANRKRGTGTREKVRSKKKGCEKTTTEKIINH
jgi:hypothetical protein